MSAYLIVNYTVEDPDQLAEYRKTAKDALRIGTEVTMLVRDGDSQRVEGDTAGSNTVVLQFESMKRAREIYQSGEYADLLALRLGATSGHFAVLVEGA